MNSKKNTYKPFGGGNSKALIARAAKKAAVRAESYTFKSRNGQPGDVGYMISSEMRSLAEERSSLYDPTASLDRWTDRGSILAAPAEAADMYLMSTGGSSNLAFNGPRYYQDELSVERNDPVSRMPVPPDVSRFPYSDEAHAASKKLAAKLAKNLAKRHFAAAVMQRSYRAMKAMKKFRAEVEEAKMAARKIQWFWRKRLYRTRAARAEWKRKCENAICIQCLGRCWLARRKVRRRKATKLRYAIITICRFFMFAKKEIKRKRGRRVRLRLHATRLQAQHRGKMGRRFVRRMHWASQRISQCFRNWWMRKRGKYAIKIFQFVRRSWVHRKVTRIQKYLRGFLGRRAFHRARLAHSSSERSRQTKENELISSELIRDVRECCYSWVLQPPQNYGNELQRDTSADFMRCLDVSSRCILYQSIDKEKKKLERRIQAIDPELNLNDVVESNKRSIALAVLAVFSNRPNGMIDYNALEMCKEYLIPARTGRPDSADDVWAELQREPMISILEASSLLEPSLSLRCRVTVQGHLPDRLLAQAVIVRRWTHHTDYLVKRAIWKSRSTFPAPYSCPECLEAVASPDALRAHLPCNSFGMPVWVNRKFYAIQMASLQNRIKLLLAYPAVERKGIEDDRKAVAIKQSSRREVAKKRGTVFATSKERVEYIRQLADGVTNLDISRKIDKKALRLAKERKQAAPSSPIKTLDSSPQPSPGSVKGSMENRSVFAAPPPGVDYIPFFEEYCPCAKESIDALVEQDWQFRPGGSEEKIQKPVRDKEGKIQNFELQLDKVQRRQQKKDKKNGNAASQKKK